MTGALGGEGGGVNQGSTRAAVQAGVTISPFNQESRRFIFIDVGTNGRYVYDYFMQYTYNELEHDLTF